MPRQIISGLSSIAAAARAIREYGQREKAEREAAEAEAYKRQQDSEMMGLRKRGVEVDEGGLSLRSRQFEHELNAPGSPEPLERIEKRDPVTGRKIISLVPRSQAAGEYEGYEPPKDDELYEQVNPDGSKTLVPKRAGVTSARPPRESQPEPLVQVQQEDGSVVWLPRSQAAGKTAPRGLGGGANRPVTSGDAGRLAELQTSLDDVKVLRGTVGTDGATGMFPQIGAALPNAITEYTGIGAGAKSRQAVIDRVRQVIGKALEGGVLRKEDEVKYTKILPTISDPDDVVETKLNGLDAAIQQRYERQLEAMEDAGYNVERYRTRGGSAKPGQPQVERWERGPDGKPRKIGGGD
jgi:hypothetical protein